MHLNLTRRSSLHDVSYSCDANREHMQAEAEKNKQLLDEKMQQDTIKNEAKEKAHAEEAKAAQEEDAKKDGVVNMNIKVNVDSPVGGALPADLANESPEEREKEEKEERRQVNMNIVVNVRSPQEASTASANPGAISAPVPPGDEDDVEDVSSVPVPPITSN
jgi:hypothetical protein